MTEMKKIRQPGGKAFLIMAVFLMCSACQNPAASGTNEQSTAQEGNAVSRPPSLTRADFLTESNRLDLPKLWQ